MGVSILMAARCAAAMDIGVCAHVGRDEFAERERAYDMMHDAGISWVRTDFEWFRCQKEKDGPFDFSLYDTVVDDARTRGLAVLPIFWSPPKWAQPDLSNLAGTRPFVVQPDAAFLDAWRTFVREAALHFKGRFSAIEIWNEENHPSFWLNPDAAAYVPVLRAAYEEIKRVDSSVTVLLGGLAGTPLDYIEALYNAGAKDFFDAMNVHPYTWPNPPDGELERQLKGLKETMAAHGDAGKPIWITEIGWPTQKARLPAQNLFLAALKAARPERTAWRVGYVGIDEDTPRGGEFAEAMRELLPPGSTAEAYTPRQLVAKLEADALDAIVYPYAESFPLRTVDAVVDFVRRGGVLVDFGGCTWFPYLDGKLVEKNPDGRLYREILQERLRTNIIFPSAENGLTPSTKTYATDAAAAAGLKPDPNGFTCFRFYDGKRLEPGDRFIPLTSARTKDGREVAGVGLYKFGSDYTGAVVMAGCGGDKGGTTEADQAEYIMRSIETARRFGVEKYFIYEFRSPGRDPYYSEDHFGIVHADFTPKAAYEALRRRSKTARAASNMSAALSEADVDALCPPRQETAAEFRAGAYPPAARPYREAALRAFAYMASLPAMRTLVETGEPEQTYQHNAYVSKTHAAHVIHMLEWARREPARRDEAMRLAAASAEYLLAQLEPPDAPLAWWPPTYGRMPLRRDPADGAENRQSMVGNEPAGAVKYRGEVMLLYPADVGTAFVAYFRATGDRRFLAAALGIGGTYLETRRPDGGWPLKMRLATGEPIGENTLVPTRPLVLFNALAGATGDARWAAAADGCFAWLEANPLMDWNWDGQFEDVQPSPPYANPTKHNAVEAMFEILRRYPGDTARFGQCRRILRFCEKRFVCWERPANHSNWDAPSVLEQYSCFAPIDASAAKMIRAYLALWRATGEPELLDKARALGDTITRVQTPEGRIPTFWTHDRLGQPLYDWLNCMEAAAAALLELADATESGSPVHAIPPP